LLREGKQPAITSAMRSAGDHPGVSVHPPLFFLCALLLGVVIDDRVRRLPIFHSDQWRWLGGIALLCGVALVAVGRKTMVKHGTNVNPTLPTLAIVESGPFRFTRNPLYVGLTGIYIGLSLLLNTWWSLFLLIPVWLVMHFAVVRREEAYLESKFGQNYLNYRGRVRRYL
jgi:protein-S-isoprenylcysteine O-methyltransferase Ste14